jgi:3-phenylpropionate/trans-cinnamate dioxygenase ferredoxin subunit
VTTSTRRWHDVGSLEELQRAGRVTARIDGRVIGVLAAPDGRLYAVRNRCPHHGAPLCLGTLQTRLGGEPGAYRLTDRLILRCPWHGWEFDVETGRCLDEPAMRTAVYAARVEGGRVLVEA